jgi:hypothetical protein
MSSFSLKSNNSKEKSFDSKEKSFDFKEKSFDYELKRLNYNYKIVKQTLIHLYFKEKKIDGESEEHYISRLITLNIYKNEINELYNRATLILSYVPYHTRGFHDIEEFPIPLNDIILMILITYICDVTCPSDVYIFLQLDHTNTYNREHVGYKALSELIIPLLINERNEKYMDIFKRLSNFICV